MKILVPTDFSTISFNALSTAKKFAGKAEDEIILMHVIEVPSVSFNSIGDVEDNSMDDIFVLELVQKVKDDLNAIKASNESVNIRTVIKMGNASQQIVDFSKKENVDLIVIGEKGISDSDDFLIGSLTDKVVRSSECAVITVNILVNDKKIKKIVYATDLKEEHPRLINILKKYQELFNAKINIVKINTRDNYTNDIDSNVRLKKLVDKYEISNYEISVYNHEDEEYGIIYHADNIEADLIAMGIHRKTGIRRLISGGDLALEVAEHTERPVLTLTFEQPKK